MGAYSLMETYCFFFLMNRVHIFFGLTISVLSVKSEKERFFVNNSSNNALYSTAIGVFISRGGLGALPVGVIAVVDGDSMGGSGALLVDVIRSLCDSDVLMVGVFISLGGSSALLVSVITFVGGDEDI